jgi:hypothetical protein
MEKTILKCITHGLVFVNSKRYKDAFERLVLHLLERVTQQTKETEKAVTKPTANQFPLI